MTGSALVLSAAAGFLIAVVTCALPGAILFRIPLFRRELRAALPAEERAFWQILLSVVWSIGVTMTLAAFSAYTFGRLVGVNLVVAAAIAVIARGRIRMADAPRPTWSIGPPLFLIALCLWRFLPVSEYVIGGKDPGVYVNEGIAISRTGTLFRRDAVVAAVPSDARDLFFRSHDREDYYGTRFMGVFLMNPASGTVISQFPHLFPASLALGYEVAGIRGATSAVAVWAIAGLLAVYLFGVRLVGSLPSFAACVLLSLNVIEVWYGGYPNAEVVMQTFVFAGLLAFSRAVRDDDHYFGWVAGALAAALIFLRFDSYIAIAGAAAATALLWIVDRRTPGWPAAAIVTAATVAAWSYYTGPLQAYFFQYRANLPSFASGTIALGVVLLAILGLRARRDRVGPFIKSNTPAGLAVALLLLAAYALFIREPAGPLAAWDAFSFRTFRDVYAFWPALLAGLAGATYLCWRRFWQEPAFFLVVTAFSIFFFYKMRIVPEHFWMARRFLPVILPALLLFAAAGAFGVPDGDRGRRTWRSVAATILLAFIGWQYSVAAAPVAAHVEYRGAIRHVQKLADRVTDRDLVIFEGRNADSDMHVFALPLAYAYGRDVLVLESPRPDRRQFESFLRWATTKYERVLFVASAGTDLLSQSIVATPLVFTPVTLPEYATTPWNEYPAGARQKDLGYCVYLLQVGEMPRQDFVLDVGTLDDLHVLRFRARETTQDRTFRWTGPQSFVAITGLAGDERELTLVMHDGGRPAKAPQATVELYFNDVPLGTIQVSSGFKEYRVPLPGDAVTAAALSRDPAQLRIVSNTWAPRDYLGGTDDRALGVMIDRVEIH